MTTNNQPTVMLDDLLAQVIQVQENAAQWEKEVKDLFQSTTKPRSTQSRIEMAIGDIVEIRLTNLLGVSRDELFERDERGQLVYGDEFEDPFQAVSGCLDDLFND